MRDLGRLLLATEIRAAWRYWQIDGKGDIYPKEFSTNGVVGCLWALKVLTLTLTLTLALTKARARHASRCILCSH
jgi:hypothetical protein